jgi:hypothetical protein
MKKIAAVYYDPVFVHLDHIAPLCYILNIPLFLEDEKLFDLAQKFYPQTKSFFKQSLCHQFLAKNFDVLISCSNWFAEDKFSFLNLNKKNMKLVLCPHGNSDKGRIEKGNMLAYTMQDMVFLYGKHMIDFLKSLNIYNKLKQHLVIGNYRLSFYKKFKSFYDQITNAMVFSRLDKKNKTILYAPTWKDKENSTSFFEIFKYLIKNVPSHYNIIIKLHPNLEYKNPAEFYQIYKETHLPNILYLNDFPLIYPLLNKCDIYLGDFSSIGYDFLYFQRPMFFIDPKQREKTSHPSLFLHNCGYQINKKHWNNIFSFIDSNLNNKFNDIQKQTYKYTYGNEKKLSEIKKIILKEI